MLEAKVMKYEDLSEDIKRDFVVENEIERIHASYLLFYEDGQFYRFESDAMGPSSYYANFQRSLSWVRDAVMQAYHKGRGETVRGYIKLRIDRKVALYDDLPEEIASKGLPEDEHTSYLLFYYKDKLYRWESDMIEDARFSKGLSWVGNAVMEAYYKGRGERE